MNTPSPSRRLNPFLFPAETDFRFLLLITAVLGASLFVYRVLVNALLRTEFAQTMLNCSGSSIAVVKACWDPFERKQALLMASGVLAVIAVAFVIYWVMPQWIIRSRRLSALSHEDGVDILDYLHRLCRQIELRHAPCFLIEPFNPAVSGLAFGRRGQYYVVLTGGLIRCYYMDRPAFQAVILHELAHLKNADVDKTYFTMSIWYAFLAVALSPFAFSLVTESIRFGANEAALAGQLLWRAAVLAALVYSVRNSVLRMREFYADARAMLHIGAPEPLERVLANLSSPTSRWQPLGAVHPLPAQRQQRLIDSLPFFRVGFGEALSTGLTIAIAVHNTVFWLTMLLPASSEWVAYPMALVIYAPLAIGVVGSGVWRSVFAAITLGIPAQPLAWISLGLGLGLTIGRQLSFDAAREALSLDEQWSVALASDLYWGLFLIGFLYLFFYWLQAGAVFWLATVTSPDSLRRVTLVGFVIGTVLLAWWLGGILQATANNYTRVVYMAYAMPTALIDSWQDFFTGYVIGWPVGWLAIALLCAFPLVGWLDRKRKSTIVDPWAFLTVVPQEDFFSGSDN